MMKPLCIGKIINNILIKLILKTIYLDSFDMKSEMGDYRHHYSN